MPIAGLVVLYVADATESAAFYAHLLDEKIVEAGPDFAMVPLGSGVMLGLWSLRAVKPPATGAAGASSEIVFNVNSPSEVDTVHAQWSERRARVIQPPHDTDFGRNFVAADPDGHRLRVLASA